MIWTTRQRSEGPGGLHFWSEGQGPAMVLIHGVGLRAEAWAAMMPLLAPHFTVYAVDMPGHGASPLRHETQLGDYTQRIAALVATLDQPIALAGHSMGAMITLDLAATAPEAVQSIAVLNAVFERAPEAAAAVQARARTLRENGPSDPAPTLERWFGTAPDANAQAASRACHDWLTHADPTGYARAYSIFATHSGPGRAVLADLQMPALFLTGADDPNSTPAMSRRLSDLVRHGQSCIVDNAAHMAPMTHPQTIAHALITHAKAATP